MHPDRNKSVHQFASNIASQCNIRHSGIWSRRLRLASLDSSETPGSKLTE
uniref:Uncharacterized protein n=1 Tax=Arundo donax TaxID=35708 RepID=A0A0A8XPP5_ARUDO